MIDTQEILSEINIHNKYAKYLPEKKRREVWYEIIDRNKEMHIKKFPQLESEIHRIYDFVYKKEILPSMRGLQFGGRPIELNNARIYNCSYLPIDHYKSFAEAMFLLLSGVGVGFSVQKHHIEKLPLIRKPRKEKKFLIGDSIEGWAESVNALVKAYYTGTFKPRFDYRDIRAKGEKLLTSGGKAPGPAPLKICLTKIETIFENKNDGDQLSTIEAHDIICHLADAVLSGGIRRAATISLFSYDDNDMLYAKSGNWWELNPQRGRANNSVVLDRSRVTKEGFLSIWKILENNRSGEPGFVFTNDPYNYGVNPCCEISLKNFGVCNLVEVNASSITSQEDLNRRVEAAAFIATLQATYTDFHFLRSIWQKTAEEESLIGVSLTGVADGEVMQYNLTEAANIVRDTNEKVSSILGIKPSRRSTTIKPSGNSSVVLKTSSGIHARHSKYYWRRMRIGKNESLYSYLTIYAPEILEQDEMNPDLAIVKVAVKSPDYSIDRTEDVMDMLDRIKIVYNEWIKPGHRKGANTNNISSTVSVKDNDWHRVGEWLWNNRDCYTGISILPYDGGTYTQMPYEDCTQKDYEDFLEKIKNITLDMSNVIELEDKTDLQGELSCAGGACEIK